MSCGTETRNKRPQLRVRNQSEYHMENVMVTYFGKRHEFGSVAPRAASKFTDFWSRVHYIPYVRATVNGVLLEHNPIDLNGANFYREGRFTLDLNIDDTDATRGPELRVLRLSAT
jgi:hypothetical protein